MEIAGSKLNFSDSASRALANVLRELAESDKSDRDIQNVLLSLSSKIPQIGKKHPMEATKILWVDDNPDNNIFEINLLQEMGIGVELFLSTDEAVEYLKTGDPIDLIISDIKRGEDDNAGYEFLDFLRGNQAYKDIPLVFYMGNVNWVQKDRVRKAQGCADTPDALIRYIKAALKKS
ncbi:MAG: response regulator [Cyanobacteria bacterium P01_G01_bin.54]